MASCGGVSLGVVTRPRGRGARLALFAGGPARPSERALHDAVVFFVGVVLFRVAAAVYFLADLLVAAAPVVVLARRVTIASSTSNTSRRVEGQWGGAGGACCEDHFCLREAFWGSRRRDDKLAYMFLVAFKT